MGHNKGENMAKIGYARVSAKDQNLARQVEALKTVDKLFQDKESGINWKREGLIQMLNYLREGDIVVITELARLGRNNKELTQTINMIQDKGATLEILDLPSLVGIADDNLRRLLNNLILEIYKYQAQSEREKIRERQAQGIKLAKREGRFKGRQPKFKSNDPRLLHAFKLYQEGKSDREVESLTGINSRTFRRYRKKYNIYRS